MEILTIPGDLTIGRKARVLRVALGWRQYKLAVRADVPPSVVSAFENDSAVYPAARRRILAVLGLDDESCDVTVLP